jgi:hypothetical protein
MMKKAISLFLAVSALCFATSAMALPTTDDLDGDVRNGVDALPTSNSNMPCFRNGDTISFNVESVTADTQLTLISYKSGETPGSSNVVYINQYDLEDTSQAVSYTIPDTTTTGTYVIKINDEGGTAATFYYKVGNIKVELIQADYSVVVDPNYGDPYKMVKITSGKHSGTYSVAFIGKVTVTGGGIGLTELGATPGFDIKDTSTNPNKHSTSRFGTSGNPTVAAFEAGVSDSTRSGRREIGGDWSFVYGLTIYNVTDGSQGNVKAKAVLD